MNIRLMDIKHKLKTNDIFRASTVRWLVAEIDAQAAEIKRLQDFEKAAGADYGKIAEFVQSLPRETRMKYFRAGRDMVPDLIAYAAQEAGA